MNSKMEYDTEYYNLFIASLFHDIGKFYQRTGLNHSNTFYKYSQEDYGTNGAHSKWSVDFVEKYWKSNLINDLILHHHNPTHSKYPELCHMLTTADHHSSSERLDNEEKIAANSRPLISVFSNISLNNKKSNEDYYLNLKELDINDDFDFVKPKSNIKEVMAGYNLEQEYKILWKKFIKDFDKIHNLNDLSTILSILKKYTIAVPSAVYTHKSDISLFDHLKTTAGLAISRYLYAKENKMFKTSNKEKVYMIINGDLSGIQKFIFKISSPDDAQKGMSKRLRGRSVYLSLLNKAIVDYIVDELNITPANILFSAGGRFTLLAPNTEESKNKIEEISNKLNEYFIKHFNAELYLSLVFEECSGEEIANFNKITKCLNHKLTNDKKQKYIQQLDKVFEIEDSVSYDNLCIVCGNKTNQKLCSDCNSHEELGRKISNAKYMLICKSSEKNSKFDVYIEVLNRGYKFINGNKELLETIEFLSNECQHVEISKLNDTNFLDLTEKINYSNVSFTFSFLGNTVPRHSIEDVYSFEQLSHISKGINKIGVLKMDVDNLGLIFSEGFDEKVYSISRVSTLSTYLDLFFSGIINNITNEYRVYESDDTDEIKIKTKDEESEISLTRNENRNNSSSTLYINYSGGDDLLVIGPYDDIMEFSLNFRNKFKEWVCNNDSITLSAGVSVVNSKFPIGKAVDYSEKNLEVSKKSGKDKITIFNEVLSWQTKGQIKGYDDLLNYSYKLEKYYNEHKLSKSLIYSFLKIWQSRYNFNSNIINENSCKKENSYKLSNKSFVPYIKYKIRLINDKKVRDDIDKEIIKYMPWIKIPVSWVSYRTR